MVTQHSNMPTPLAAIDKVNYLGVVRSPFPFAMMLAAFQLGLGVRSGEGVLCKPSFNPS